MIIKTLSRKSGIRKLITYIFKEQTVTEVIPAKSWYYIPKNVVFTEKDKQLLKIEAAYRKEDKLFQEFFAKTGSKDFYEFMAYCEARTQAPFVIKQNMRTRSINGYVKELEKNEEGRIRKSVNQVAAYHTILSWSPKDAHLMSDQMLKEIAGHYMQLRGDNIMIVGTKHSDKGHLHLHLAESATQLNGKSSRLSKQQFATIKQQLQEFQKERYPDLFNSLPQHGKGKNLGKEELKNIKRHERSSYNDKLIQLIETNARSCSSLKELESSLAKEKVQTYYSSGKLTGLEYEGMKFRFSRLGVEEMIKEISLRETRNVKELQSLRAIREQVYKQRDRLVKKEENKSIELNEEMQSLSSLREQGREDNEREIVQDDTVKGNDNFEQEDENEAEEQDEQGYANQTEQVNDSDEENQ